jgi:hypothetical protein
MTLLSEWTAAASINSSLLIAFAFAPARAKKKAILLGKVQWAREDDVVQSPGKSSPVRTSFKAVMQ